MFLRYCRSKWRVVLPWLAVFILIYGWMTTGDSVQPSPNELAVMMNDTRGTSKWKTMARILAQLAGTYPSVYERPIVLLLSYQRCGSSFLGQLFNQNNQAFYVFEPGDSVYMSLYGTAAGWNVPSDITHFWDGQKRSLPAHETTAFANTIMNLMYCNMDKINSEFYLHMFWNKFPDSLGRLFPFQKCVARTKLTIDTCRKPHISDACPERFGSDIHMHEQCRRRMYETYADMYGNRSLYADVDQSTQYNVFREYYRCLNDARQKIIECIQNMEYVCTKSRLASVKTVRASMDTVEVLLKMLPNLKILHLIRDPRAVARSRMTRPSFRGHYSVKDMVKEASLYCEDVTSDILKRKDLEKKYPGSFMEIIYEGFISDPLKSAEKVYKFLNVGLPLEVSHWLYRYTSQKKNASRISEKWQDTVPYRTTLNINKKCEQLFKHVNYTWP